MRAGRLERHRYGRGGCKDAGEDPNDDGDGLDDATDACDLLAAATTSGCPAATGTLTIKYSAHKKRFSGKLASSESTCLPGREVDVYQQVPGADRKRGTAITNGQGAYKLEKPAKPGKHYASVDQSVLADLAECGAAQSPKTTVR